MEMVPTAADWFLYFFCSKGKKEEQIPSTPAVVWSVFSSGDVSHTHTHTHTKIIYTLCNSVAAVFFFLFRLVSMLSFWCSLEVFDGLILGAVVIVMCHRLLCTCRSHAHTPLGRVSRHKSVKTFLPLFLSIIRRTRMPKGQKTRWSTKD